LVFFFLSGEVKSKKPVYFFIQETDGNRFTYYGIVFLSSRKAGLRVIKQLNGRRFKQRVIQVREFITRSRTNDRRLTQKRGAQDFLEKRKTERRRDVWDHLGNEKRLVADSSIFERENVYLPRRQR
jgi:hypothetical protein